MWTLSLSSCPRLAAFPSRTGVLRPAIAFFVRRRGCASAGFDEIFTVAFDDFFVFGQLGVARALMPVSFPSRTGGLRPAIAFFARRRGGALTWFDEIFTVETRWIVGSVSLALARCSFVYLLCHGLAWLQERRS